MSNILVTFETKKDKIIEKQKKVCFEFIHHPQILLLLLQLQQILLLLL